MAYLPSMVSSYDGGLLSGTELVTLISPTEKAPNNDLSTCSAACLALAPLQSALAAGSGVALTGSGVATTGSSTAASTSSTCSGSAKSSSSVASWAFFLFFFLANCLA